MRSIRSIIFIRLFAIILIFFAVVSAFANLLCAETMRQFVVADAETSLSFIANNIEVNYKTDLTSLDGVPQMPGFMPFDESIAARTVSEFLRLPNVFSTVHMYKANGDLVFAELRPDPSNEPYSPKKNFHQKDARFIELAESVIAGKQSRASPTFFTKNGSLYQVYVVPVFEDKEKQHVLGILSGAVFPQWKKIDYLLKGLKLGRDNFILITDNSGNLISSDGIDDAGIRQLKSFTDAANQKFFVADNTAAKPKSIFLREGMHINRDSFMIMAVPISDLRLVVTLGVNTHPLDQKIREMSNRLLVALIIGLVLCLAASAYVGERLARPFRDMAQTINEINTGNFAARTKYGANDEIGYLSERINTLAQKIQKSEYLGNLWSTENELEAQREPDRDSTTTA